MDGLKQNTHESQGERNAALLRAARRGELGKLCDYLKPGYADLNVTNQNGLNCLHLASKEGHADIVGELLRRGMNADARTKAWSNGDRAINIVDDRKKFFESLKFEEWRNLVAEYSHRNKKTRVLILYLEPSVLNKGNASLHIASLAGNERVVKLLVQHGARVNSQSQLGFTPLYMAAQEDHPEIVQFLLDNGADPMLATEDGYTPLSVAMQQGHKKVAALLMDHDTRSKVRLPPLHAAAKKDDVKAAMLLLGRQHDVNETTRTGFTPLHIASHYGSANVAQLLIENGAGLNMPARNEITALHVASKWGRLNTTVILINNGATIDCKTKDNLTPLHCACRNGHMEVAAALLERGAQVGAKTRNGLTALHMSAQGDHEDCVELLLRHGANIEDVTMDYLTALHVAAHCGNVRIAARLLENGCQVNARALNGFTPLHVACKKNRVKVIELLLRYGVLIECTTETGLTPLHVSSFMGYVQIVACLLENGANTEAPTTRGETAMHLAARASQNEVMRTLLQGRANVDANAKEQQTPLHICARLGNAEGVQILLEQGASVDAVTKDLYTALHLAVKDGYEDVIFLLLDHGAKQNLKTAKGFTPLHIAAKYGNVNVTRLLLQKNGDPSVKGQNGLTPLHVATHYNRTEVAKVLLDASASPHDIAKNGYTALHIAAKKNHLALARVLLDNGALPNAESKNGYTSLHLAAQEGHVEMVQLLLSCGSKVNSTSKNSLTPMHLAAQEDHVPVAEVLANYKSEIDPQTKAGYTPLHTAAHFGQVNMIEFLLRHQSEINATTKLGYTPLHQASQQGYVPIVNLLLQNGASPDKLTTGGQSALSIAQQLNFVQVVEVLSQITNVSAAMPSHLEYCIVSPEMMQETMVDSDEEGGDDVFCSTPKHTTDELRLQLEGANYEQSEQYLQAGDYRAIQRKKLQQLHDQDLFAFENHSGRYSTMSSTGGLGGHDPIHDELRYMRDDTELHSGAMTPSATLSSSTRGNSSYGMATPAAFSTDDDFKYVNLMREDSSGDVLSPAVGYSTMAEAGQMLEGKLAARAQSEEQLEDEDVFIRASTNEALFSTEFNPDNVKVNRQLISSGFLVSFLVDARGGLLSSPRHSGVRIIVPPGSACMPTRITCKLVKKEKLTNPPPIMEGEGLASRILQMSPAGMSFSGSLLLEVPHYASLANSQREIVIMRSDNGRTWHEHSVQASYNEAKTVLGDSVKLDNAEEIYGKPIARIITDTLPAYFAVVTRIRHDALTLGPSGGSLVSSVDPLVCSIFPANALTKNIKVGLQVHTLSPDLVSKTVGDHVTVSPVVTVEPRHRKFHQPISITIPLPAGGGGAGGGAGSDRRQTSTPILRLLCSIVGGMAQSQWEDITGSSPMTLTSETVTFTTTVSARFMLMECRNIRDSASFADSLFREAIVVPYITKFVVFGKRRNAFEARLRTFALTDDERAEKTLEGQQRFVELARSKEIEIYETKPLYVETAGNLTVHDTKSLSLSTTPQPLLINFGPLKENRLAFSVRLRDPNGDPSGQIIFLHDLQPTTRLDTAAMTPPSRPLPVCVLGVTLPEVTSRDTAPTTSSLLTPDDDSTDVSEWSRAGERTPGMDLMGVQDVFKLPGVGKGTISVSRGELHLSDIAHELDEDWNRLALRLGFKEQEIQRIEQQSDSSEEQALTMLHIWAQRQCAGRSDTFVHDLERTLEDIGREDIVYACIRNVQKVTDAQEIEHAIAIIEQDVNFDTKRNQKQKVEEFSKNPKNDQTTFSEKAWSNEPSADGQDEVDNSAIDLLSALTDAPVQSAPDTRTGSAQGEPDIRTDTILGAPDDPADGDVYRTFSSTVQSAPENGKEMDDQDDSDDHTDIFRVHCSTAQSAPEFNTDTVESEETLEDGSVETRRVTQTIERRTITTTYVVEDHEDGEGPGVYGEEGDMEAEMTNNDETEERERYGNMEETREGGREWEVEGGDEEEGNERKDTREREGRQNDGGEYMERMEDEGGEEDGEPHEGDFKGFRDGDDSVACQIGREGDEAYQDGGEGEELQWGGERELLGEVVEEGEDVEEERSDGWTVQKAGEERFDEDDMPTTVTDEQQQTLINGQMIGENNILQDTPDDE